MKLKRRRRRQALARMSFRVLACRQIRTWSIAVLIPAHLKLIEISLMNRLCKSSVTSFVGLLMCVCVSASAQQHQESDSKDKPRIIVLTDITNEPDDQQSLVRFLVYSNEFNVEGLIATTSTWLRDRTSPENIRQCVDAYDKVRNQLAKHAAGFPTAKSLRDRIKDGLPMYGMKGVGEGHDSEGSRHIIEVVDGDDPKPVWVTAWGGTNCLAQALWRVKEERSAEEVDKFVAKLRVYTISDQDDSGQWLRRTFPKLFYVVSPGGQSFKDYHLSLIHV